MTGFSMRAMRVGAGAAVAGMIIVLAACAPTPESSPPPSATPSPEATAPEPYAGPVVFVGDELEAFALSPEEITGIVPEATEVGAVSSVLAQVSDGGGAPASPSICEALYAEQSLGTVGARTLEWQVPADPRYGFGRLLVLQFADEAHAQARMDQLLQAAQQCADFTKGGAVTFDAVIPEESGDVRAYAGTLIDPGLDWQSFDAFASTGNVIVQLWQPFTGDRTFDAEAAALLLQTRAAEARAGLIDELTENPPTPEEDPSADASAPWADWQVGVDGVGPVRLGDAVDTAVAAAGGSQTIEPEYDGGPWRILNDEGSGSILIQPVEGGDTVASVTVGNERSLDETAQDGSALPSRSDVRVGDPVADAMEAFPGGTIVDVASSGDDFYLVADRDGHVFRFQTDRDAVDDGATIVGITVEDATARTSAVFG